MALVHYANSARVLKFNPNLNPYYRVTRVPSSHVMCGLALPTDKCDDGAVLYRFICIFICV